MLTSLWGAQVVQMIRGFQQTCGGIRKQNRFAFQIEQTVVWQYLTLSIPIPDEEKKLTLIFIFILLCGASKGFMKALKALKAFIKTFEAPQRSVKIKKVTFYFNINFLNAQGGKG